jgi:FkbM family methyltransferase
MIHYFIRLNAIRKIVSNWHAILFYDVARALLSPKNGKYTRLLILHVKKPKAKIIIRDVFDMTTLLQIFGENIYFYRDVTIEEDDKLILDIGSHIGLFSIFCALTHNQPKIYAFEPFPDNYNLLLYNLRLNNLSSRVTAQKFALSDKDGLVKLYLSDSDLSHSTAPMKWNVKKSDYLLVKATTLRSIFTHQAFQKVDFMKANCEGCEYKIFTKRNADCLEKIHKLSIQCHNFDCEHNYKTIKRLLNQLGFKVHTRHYDDRHTFLYAKL